MSVASVQTAFPTHQADRNPCSATVPEFQVRKDRSASGLESRPASGITGTKLSQNLCLALISRYDIYVAATQPDLPCLAHRFPESTEFVSCTSLVGRLTQAYTGKFITVIVVKCNPVLFIFFYCLLFASLTLCKTARYL